MAEKVIHAWCDGSYRPVHKTAGAGWLVRWFDNSLAEGKLCLAGQKNSFEHGSERAELLAAANALRMIADRLNGESAAVIVHMDDQSASESLKTGKMKIKNPGDDLKVAHEEALKQKARLCSGSVSFEWVDRSNPNMQKANNLARTASSPSGGKGQKGLRP